MTGDDDPLLSPLSSPPPPLKKPTTTFYYRLGLFTSVAANMGFAITGLFFFFITSNEFPNPPTPVPHFNGSCPYARNTTSTAGTVEFSAYDVGPTHIKLCWPVMAHAERDNAPYQVEVDDWYTHRTSFRTAYAGALNDITLTNLLPGQPIHVRLKVNTHVSPGSAIRTSETLALFTTNATYCGNPKDMLILRNASHMDMPVRLQNCAFATNMVTCIEQSLGFSKGCSTCFAGENSCIIKNCVDKNKFICLTKPKSIMCKRCINDYCMPPTAKCAGVPLWALNITSFPLTPS